MANIALDKDFRLTDDLERRLVSQMAREQSNKVAAAPRGVFAGIGRALAAGRKFLDNLDSTMKGAAGVEGRYS